jgi:hypothetical protein
MSIKKQQHPVLVVNRFFLALLFFFSISAFSAAQEHYTVNRPVLTPTVLQKDVPEYIPQHIVPIDWETDYEYAMKTAEQSTRYLLIYLYADGGSELPESMASLPVIPACREFGTVVLDDDFVRSGLAGHVLLKLPMDTKITGEDGTKQSIYSLPGFEHMLEHPGLVVVDFANRDTSYYGEVVGILPFLWGDCPTAKQSATFLNLPSGTLTQRTLTYAVRIHPNQPLSSDGKPLPIVVQAATEHALYQAERGILGHQNYGKRSYQVREVLGGGSPSEICAQSRSGLGLFEGAIACMRLWRNSGAHWSICRRHHTYYGYDMARSKSGAWFAVGFFID